MSAHRTVRMHAIENRYESRARTQTDLQMTPALTQHLRDSTPPKLNDLLQKNAARFTPTIIPIGRSENPLGTNLDHFDII